jgi:hypothetical protein
MDIERARRELDPKPSERHGPSADGFFAKLTIWFSPCGAAMARAYDRLFRLGTADLLLT